MTSSHSWVYFVFFFFFTFDFLPMYVCPNQSESIAFRLAMIWPWEAHREVHCRHRYQTHNNVTHLQFFFKSQHLSYLLIVHHSESFSHPWDCCACAQTSCFHSNRSLFARIYSVQNLKTCRRSQPAPDHCWQACSWLAAPGFFLSVTTPSNFTNPENDRCGADQWNERCSCVGVYRSSRLRLIKLFTF